MYYIYPFVRRSYDIASNSLSDSLLSASSMFFISSSRRYSSLEDRRLLKSNLVSCIYIYCYCITILFSSPLGGGWGGTYFLTFIKITAISASISKAKAAYANASVVCSEAGWKSSTIL